MSPAKSGKKMATDNKKAKIDTAPRTDAAAEVKNTAVKEASTTEGVETTGAAPASYSRGEGQKPVTKAYKENWNVIFGKKNNKKSRTK